MNKIKFEILAFFLLFTMIFRVEAQEISPMLVGTNVWLNPPESVWGMAREAQLGAVRIGGHRYDKELPSLETLLKWVKQIKEIGAEPIIQVSKYESPERAAAVVRFLNVQHGMNVKYWGIGNEPWLQYNKPPINEMAAKVEAYWKPRAKAMKRIDPTIKIYGPNACDYLDEMYADLFGGKNDITIKVPGKDYYYCDGLTFHRYHQGDGNPGTYGADDLIKRIKKAKKTIDEVNTKTGRTGEDALVWGIGEFNSKGGPQVHTWGNGQMFGQVLGACMKYEAAFATTWSMFEHGGNRKGTDFSMIDGNGTPRASYRHMEFVAKNFKGEYITGTSSSDEVIIHAAKDQEEVVVMIINRDGGSKEYTLSLLGELQTETTVVLNVMAENSIVYEDKIEAQSTQVLIFNGNLLSKWEYNSELFNNDLPPTLETKNL